MFAFTIIDMNNPLDLITKTIQSTIEASPTEINLFFDHFKLQKLKADEYFIREGEVCNKIGFITKGMIRYFYVDDQEETTRWVSLEGEFATSLGSFITGQPCSHHLQAIGSCDVWVISKSNWQKLSKHHEWLRNFWTRVLEITCVGFEDRVYQQLASSAEQRYEYMMKRYPHFIEKVPQKYVASMMGIKPESLSRVRAQMARKRRT